MSDNELLAPGTTGLGGRRSGATTPDDQNPRRGGSGYGDVTPIPPVDPSTDPRSAGLVRPRRRVINGSEKKSRVGAGVVRNYQVVDEVVFTNYSELRNDMMSSAFAQEVLESFFVSCDIDLTNPKAATMAEDVVLTFYIQNAASQKTAHDLVVDIYGKELDMMVLLRLLVSHEQTPRRFTRGLADRIFEFLKKPENEPLRVSVAAAHSLEDPKYATIAFDGSTHVTDLPPDYRSVANMLMSRGIFDNYAAEKSRSESATYDAVTRSAGVRSGQAGLTRT